MRAHEAGALHAEGYGGPPLYLPYPEDVNALLPQLWARTVHRGEDGALRAGDLIAVPGTGAYCRSLSSQYNHTPRPPVVAVRDGRARLIVRRETVEDILALDVG